MKKLPNIVFKFKSSPENERSESCYELDSEHLVLSYMRYAKSTEYWGRNNIHTLKLTWVVMEKNTFLPLAYGDSRKQAIQNFRKIKN